MGAAPFGHNSFRTRRQRRGRSPPMSEINVTPFVDVMLVLLIVFMVAAPLLASGVPVDLPEAQAKPLEIESEPITVTVDQDGRVFLADSEVAIEDIVIRLNDVVTEGLDERIYVRGDRSASYGAIMRVMGVINGAGYRRIGLVALEEPDG